MNPREPKVYWIRRPKGEKDLLIFDAGYERGLIHIYEHKESIKIEEIRKQVESLGFKPLDDYEAVLLWVETKFGHSMSWKLEP